MKHRDKEIQNNSSAAEAPDQQQTIHADIEPFVNADAVASFIDDTRRNVLRMVRQGKLTCYPVSGLERHTYKFKISEVARDIEKVRRPSGMASGEASNGSDKKKRR